MGHTCCEKLWHGIRWSSYSPNLKCMKSETHQMDFITFFSANECTSHKKKGNMYWRLLTKTSDNWKVFKLKNPININAFILFKCTFFYYCPDCLAGYLGNTKPLQSWSYPFPLAALTWSSLWHRNTWKSLQLEKKDMVCYTLHIRHGTSVIIST